MSPLTKSAIRQQLEEARRRRRIPRATYRVQFNAGFTFRDAERLVPYLHALGISDLYASPILLATPGSTHGYDVCDPGKLNPELGTEEDFLRLVETLRRHDMGWIQDIVPNHMGIDGNCNAWWMDVLENGPSSRYASYFDIDWDPVKPELRDKVLLPILEDQYGMVLDSGRFEVRYANGTFRIAYGTLELPVAPNTYDHILAPLVEVLVEALGPDNEDVRELQSILTAVSHLPPQATRDPALVEEKLREQAVIKRRLAALVEKSEAVQAALDATLRRLNGLPGDPRSFDRLHALIERQSYRMAFWRVAGEEINYRRFFDINTMAAIRSELPEAFAATHDLILRLLAEGILTGLRVDHPDGLWDPPGYFRALQENFLFRTVCAGADLTAEEQAEVREVVSEWLNEQIETRDHFEWPLYVVAEKILTENEPLPPDWAVYGTTGYDFMNQVNGLFVDTEAAGRFDRIYRAFTGVEVDIHDLEYASKQKIMRESLAGEINSIAHQLERLSERNRHTRDFTLNGLRHALREIVACMGIYRTYITGPDTVSRRDQLFVEAAVKEALRRNPLVSQPVLYFLRDTLLLCNYFDFDEADRDTLVRLVMRFQQITGPVMAKSVEDTAFYAYNRLVSLNEVGGTPAVFGVTPDEFHQQNQKRLKSWPHAMIALSTHDTKRSEDVRARLNVLSELPDEWEAGLGRWRELNARHRQSAPDGDWPDANDEYLLYQTLLGAWPADDDVAIGGDGWTDFQERIAGYMAKATKEAKVHTSWTNPNEAYDQAMRDFVLRVLDPVDNRAFIEDFLSFQRRVAFFGYLNSLSQTLLKLTSPGVPDTYRGTETLDFSLVDPDNRRPVDYDDLFSRRERLPVRNRPDDEVQLTFLNELLETPRSAKLFLTQTVLCFRRDRDVLFRRGSYTPLAATGEKARHVCAFAREHDGAAVVVVAPRLVAGLTAGETRMPLGDVWGETQLVLPEALQHKALTDIFTGQTIGRAANGQIPLAGILCYFPVAVLTT